VARGKLQRAAEAPQDKQGLPRDPQGHDYAKKGIVEENQGLLREQGSQNVRRRGVRRERRSAVQNLLLLQSQGATKG